MNFKNLIHKTRSYRRFKQDPIPKEIILDLVDCARLTSSQRNCQSLRYILSNDPKKNDLIFSTLTWAGALKDWDGPEIGERPMAYIVILTDKTIAQEARIDLGIASQTIMLGAQEKGIGGCMLGSINRSHLASELGVSDQYDILLVLALGVPGEEVVVDEVDSSTSLTYYRDENDVHHVPKLRCDQVILSK